MKPLHVLNNPDVAPAIDRTQLAAELERVLPGRVRFSRQHQALYATDASIYQIEPIGLIVPESVEDIRTAVEFCGRNRIPILPRGGGTSLAGQCTNHAVVIDYSSHCRRAVSVDPAARTCHVEPGMTVDEVNRWLENGTQLVYAPDPATAAQATIGGCIGNNAAGARSIRYGRTSENIAALDVVLSTGERLWLEPGAGRRNGTALRLAQSMAQLVQRYAAEIRDCFPKTLRRNAGYALDLILHQLDRGVPAEDLDLTGLLCGSEGTLAVVVGAKLKLHPVARSKGLAIVSFQSVEDAIAAVPACVASGACAVELLDDVVLSAARGNAECRRYLELVPRIDGNEPQGVLYVEYQETGPIDEVHERFATLRRILPGATMGEYVDKPSLAKLWALRKAGEPLLHGLAGHRKPVTCVEDNAIPLENLAMFVDEFKKIVTRHGTKAAYYAHASVGVLHVRPMLDLHDPADRDRLRAIAVEVADLARRCGGVMSGEHGDGRIRGPLLERFYGPVIMQAFRETKEIFDPAGILNPGMITTPGPIESITLNLRINPGGPDLKWPDVEPYFDYSDQEGFSGAVEMCNGAGVCRKTAGGVMCPSYRGTMDERHSTRGRGNALRMAISGQLHNTPGHPAWADPETVETLHLCLSCKACKSECPSNVDIARLKAEYTAQRYQHTGDVPLSARLFGHVRKLNQLGSIMPDIANWVSSLAPVRRVLDEVLNLAPQRTLPPFATSLYRWFAGHPLPADHADRPKVVLFADCFVTYNEPQIGQAAVAVLEKLGYYVLLPKVGCCGRSMISNGLLDDAIRSGDAVVEQLRPYVEDPRVRAIVVCEPSCLSVMKDEWQQLRMKSDRGLRRRLGEKAMLVEEFVEKQWDAHPVRPELQGNGHAVFHGHCHQKALWGEDLTATALKRVLGNGLKVLPSGCCGMAGAFGYTKDRYDLSMKIGKLSLFDAVNETAPDTQVIAGGTSCRHQIRDGTHREALHPIQVIARALA